VLPLSTPQPISSAIWNIATITFHLRKSDEDKLVTFSISNCPGAGLPIGITEDRSCISFDTTSDDSFSGREEIVLIKSTDRFEQSLAAAPSQPTGGMFSFPNPFNPATTIRYELKEPSEVHMDIFDVQGKLVTELVRAHQLEGMHSAFWEPAQASSGTYFARLTIQGTISNFKEVKTLKLAYAK
jgi:hypothetical protein